ncbi:Gfo/Idh/MocA family protein [Solibacillus daqui]|uniref:Gfo/Idh/MocA family protein n=1 Tax=Solibacillus daqui TaxID=2912187 RepID=UPI002365EA1E|nr:Gfo/Idh/MocA family oxidoreductase [Solibacillus daqui]
MNIGIMSFAHIHATSYADAIKRIPGATLTAIYDTDNNRGQQASEQYEVPFFTDIQLFLAQPIDVVLVCSENILHKEMVIAAAKAKKHILCEKPIATTVEDAKDMIAVCDQNEVQLSIAYPVRYSAAIRDVKQAIEAGELGDIVAIRSTNRGQNPGGWFIDEQLAGGGAVLDHTVHMVDIMRWYLNSEVAEVSAFANRYFTELDTDDAGIMTIVFENGVIASHDASWSRFPQFPTWGDVMIEIIGTKATRKVDVFNEKLNLYSKGEKSITHLYSGNNTDFELIVDFLQAIQQGRKPLISGYDGLKSLEIALAAYESNAKKQAVIV